MTYTKQQWRNGPEGTTPLDASAMSHIEQGIGDAHDLTGVDDSSVLSTDPAQASQTKPWPAARSIRQILGIINDASTTALNRVWSVAKTKDYVDTAVASVSGGGTGGGSSALIDPTSSAYAGGMGTGKTAAQNGAALQAAIIAANGKTVKPPAGEYDIVGAAIADQHVNLDLHGVWFRHPQGNTPALVVERTPADPISVGPTYLTWWGPFLPSGVSVSGLMQVIPATGLARFKGGRMMRIRSRDAFPWSWSSLNIYNVGQAADYSRTDGLVYQAEDFPLLGIGLKVSGVNASSPPLEQMMVRGDNSGATGMISAKLLGNGSGGLTATEAHLTFTSITGADFITGENLVRVEGGNPGAGPSGSTIPAVGATVGQVASPGVLLTTDLFLFQYGRTTSATAATGTPTPVRTDNTVQVREIDTKPMCKIIGLGVDVAGGDREAPDSYIASANRVDAIQLRGVYAPEVEWRVRNSWTRALCVWSCYMPRFRGFADQAPNRAILTSNGFGYGLELKGGCKGADVVLQGHSIRHLFTTNPNERTYFAANNYDSGKWAEWDYGTPQRTRVHDFRVEAAFAPGMDTHAGDYFTVFENGSIYGGGSGGRYNTDNNAACTSRGFGTKWKNVQVENSGVGFLIGGVEHDAGMNHRYRLENVTVGGALAQAVVTPNAMVPGQATIEVDGGSYSMRASYPKDAAGTAENTLTGKYGIQTCFQVGSGVNLEVSGETKFRRFGAAAITMRGTGDLTLWSADIDFTECPGSASGVRMDVGTGVVTTARVYDVKTKGSAFAVLRNVSGNTNWLVSRDGIRSLGGTVPANVTSAGSPAWTSVDPLVLDV